MSPLPKASFSIARLFLDVLLDVRDSRRCDRRQGEGHHGRRGGGSHGLSRRALRGAGVRCFAEPGSVSRSGSGHGCLCIALALSVGPLSGRLVCGGGLSSGSGARLLSIGRRLDRSFCGSLAYGEGRKPFDFRPSRHSRARYRAGLATGLRPSEAEVGFLVSFQVRVIAPPRPTCLAPQQDSVEGSR